jgi:septum formation protein
MTLILASKSASRRAMLDAAGIPHESLVSDVDEDAIKTQMAGEPVARIATALAEAKALAVSAIASDRSVIGGDSMVSVAGRRFDKPKSREDAATHLRFFSGKPLRLYSAAALARNGQVLTSFCEEAILHVRPLSPDFIDSYLDAEWPAIAGCVGCFRMEAMGVQLFDRLEGDHFTILGMPLLQLLSALRAEGLVAA